MGLIRKTNTCCSKLNDSISLYWHTMLSKYLNFFALEDNSFPQINFGFKLLFFFETKFCSWHDKAMLFEHYHWKKAMEKNKPYEFQVSFLISFFHINSCCSWPDLQHRNTDSKSSYSHSFRNLHEIALFWKYWLKTIIHPSVTVWFPTLERQPFILW